MIVIQITRIIIGGGIVCPIAAEGRAGEEEGSGHACGSVLPQAWARGAMYRRVLET